MNAIRSAGANSSLRPGPRKEATSTRTGTDMGTVRSRLAATQEQFPNYRLSLVSGIEAHNNFVRFSWAAGGTADAPLYIGGTDFATIASDGRINTVTGFMDAAPAM
jgi:hypothetical protein